MKPKICVLEDKRCINCGECDKCDINPEKLCDNCEQCLNKPDAPFFKIQIDQIYGEDK